MDKISKEELEQMAYDDIAFVVLKNANTKMKIQALFKKVCQLLNLSDEEFETKIGDFFELLSTDKRFIMLENGYWDIRDNHSHKIVLEDDDSENLFDELAEDVEDLDDDEALDDEFYDDEVDDDEADNDLKDLVIIDEDEIDNDDLV